jgi:hypothetical protein
LEATVEQRPHWKVSGAGYGIHWPDIEEDLSTEGLLRGAPAAALPLVRLRHSPSVGSPLILTLPDDAFALSSNNRQIVTRFNRSGAMSIGAQDILARKKVESGLLKDKILSEQVIHVLSPKVIHLVKGFTIHQDRKPECENFQKF